MRYKKSKYNVEIDHLEDGRILLYNTYSGIFGIMDTDTQAIYNDIDNVDISLITDSEIKKSCETLIRYGYIVEDNIDELAVYKLERANKRAMSSVLGLTIATTMACNMRCPYCYESKNGKTMSKETQEKLVSFVKAHFTEQPNFKKMSVTWYGGEPLLQKDTIYELSEAFLRICKEHEISYEAVIITNGALLDKITAQKLYNDCHVRRAQITIDGMPELHNKRRIFTDGTGSFDLIVHNIEEIRSFFPISIRMNVDKTNMAEVEKFLKFAVNEMKWINNPNIYVAPVDSYTENCAHASPMCFARPEFAEIKSKFQKMNYNVNRDRVKYEFFPHRSVLHCGAEWQFNYVIDPEGYYYTCWMVIGEKAHRCGHIDRPFAVTTEYYKWLSSEIPHKCEACEYLPMCAGGCGYFRIIKDGEPNCPRTYYSYKNTLRLAYHDYLCQKENNGKQSK